MNKSKDIVKLFLSFIVFYFASSILVVFIKYGLGIDTSTLSIKNLALIEMLFTFFFAIIYTILHFDVIKYSFKDLKGKKVTQFISAVVTGLLIVYGAQIFASIIENLLSIIIGLEQESVVNQQSFEVLLKSAPVIAIISACILAPIEEELLFRGAVGKVFKNKKVFIAVSGLIFGLAHVTDSVMFLGEFILLGIVFDLITENPNRKKRIMLSVISTVLILFVFGIFYYFEYGNLIIKIQNLDLNEVIGSISYIFAGCAIAYNYVLNNRNILVNMGMHAVINTIAVLITLCLK
ncbi:MAG: CPBP family intramembrane metalloprotease [Erysipelotrichales bacterium]|nr:CPBP family intramembrane metalloprotease [Erysipelotrichales bacterium]